MSGWLGVGTMKLSQLALFCLVLASWMVPVGAFCWAMAGLLVGTTDGSSMYFHEERHVDCAVTLYILISGGTLVCLFGG